MTESLFDRKGYQIRIVCPGAVQAEYLGITGTEKGIACEILYLGAAVPERGEEADPDDPFAFGLIRSPRQIPFEEGAVFGIETDDQKRVYAGFWNQFVLKDPGIGKSGLTFRYRVPEGVDAVRPDFQVYLEGQLVFRTKLDRAGVFEEHFDVKRAVKPLQTYLEKTHSADKALLVEVSRICKKYRIRYYLICGTLLGAVRHGDLIPWDDDADIAMPRRDFDRFLLAARREWKKGSSFKILRPESFKGSFLDFMTRVVYLKEPAGSSLFDRLGADGAEYKDAAALDLFVLENASESALFHRIQTQLIRAVYGLCLSKRPVADPKMFDGKPQKEQRVAKKLIKIGRYIPLSLLLGFYRFICGWFKGRKNAKSYFLSNGYIMCVPWKWEKSWFGTGRQAKLGDLQVMIPSDPDACLRKQYGDYMALPHPYLRVPAHFRSGE